MSYNNQTAVAVAGMWGKGGQSTQKAFGAQNVGSTVLAKGRFVALAENGVKELSATADKVAGVVVHEAGKAEFAAGDYLSVGTLAHGDSLWVELEGSATVGKAVFVRVVGDVDKPAGAVLTAAVSGKTVPTDYAVLACTGSLALIGRLA